MELPIRFCEKMKALLGAEEFYEYEKSLEQPGFRGLRVNTGKMEAEEFARISPFPCAKISWIPNGYLIPPDAPASRHPYYAAGLYYLQEPSAMTPARALPIEPGDRVLDLCAAPGGKATELAARLKGKGLLVANDISNSRAKGLLKNLELFGAPNILVTSESPQRLSGYFPAFFDKILIDAPCSGEGMFRKDPSMIKSWLEHGPEYYAPIQLEILLWAAHMLRPGGLILYSTCTFDPLENEGSIQALLEADASFSVVRPDSDLEQLFLDAGFCPGRPDLIENGKEELSRCFRLYPHRVKGEGHFLALLKKKGTQETGSVSNDSALNGSAFDSAVLNGSGFNSSALKNRKKSPSRKKASSEPKKKEGPDQTALLEFLTQLSAKGTAENGDQAASCNFELCIRQEQVYALPAKLPSLQGLRFLRTGCYLGELAKQRFEPSQALAMALKKENWPYVLDLSLDDERVIRYLKGESLDLKAEEAEGFEKKGWILVCVNGFSLGWGKMVNGSLRNKYYPGWRW